MSLGEVLIEKPHKTVYRDGGRVIKVFGEGYTKAGVLNEALNQARVEDIGLNVPKVLEVAMYDGKWAIVGEYIEGRTIAQLIADGPKDRDRLIERMVGLQIEMHGKRAEHLNRLQEQLHGKISACSPYLNEGVRYELHMRLNSMQKHAKVCHGDFCPENVIITKDDKAYILDWAHASQGNASADAAQTYLLYFLHGDLETAGLYLDCFCRMSGIDLQLVKAWLPIIAAARLTLGRAEERELLLSWTNVHFE